MRLCPEKLYKLNKRPPLPTKSRSENCWSSTVWFKHTRYCILVQVTMERCYIKKRMIFHVQQRFPGSRVGRNMVKNSILYSVNWTHIERVLLVFSKLKSFYLQGLTELQIVVLYIKKEKVENWFCLGYTHISEELFLLLNFKCILTFCLVIDFGPKFAYVFWKIFSILLNFTDSLPPPNFLVTHIFGS